jgi:uncharacterized protein (DUF58 family)
VVLGRRRLYILPTAQGFVLALLLVGMLLGALNYNNSLAFALTFLLAGLGLVVMHHAHRNLLGLELRFLPAEPVFAGCEAALPFRVSNPTPLPRHDLVLAAGGARSRPFDLAPGESRKVTVPAPTERRGPLRVGDVGLEGGFPGQLFRVWTWLAREAEGLVWPAPADHAPLPADGGSGGAGEERVTGGDDFRGLRDYHPGDSPRHIAWKALAHSDEPMVKLFGGTASEPVWLDYEEAPGEHEKRLAVLCRWCIDAHRAGRPYGLRLPDRVVPPDQGEAQLGRALDALALTGDSPR